MEMTLRSMTKTEQLFCSPQSKQIRERTGSLGQLQTRLESGRERASSDWKPFETGQEALECRAELDRIVDELMFGDPEKESVLNRAALVKYCFGRRRDRRTDPHRYRFRIDTERFAHLMDMRQYRSGTYVLDCSCYRKDLLDSHLERAAKGIRFTDGGGRELFVLPDGGRIRITYPDGYSREEICRYVDPFRMEIGNGPLNLFRMEEFAEVMEQDGATAEPLDRMPEKGKTP